MAQTIITLCDPHLTEDDQEVRAMSYRLGVNLPGESRWGWFEVDLCPDHAESLTDLSLFLAKYGRAFDPGDQAPKAPKRRHDKRRAPAPPQTSDGFVCDVDGCGRDFAKLQAYRMHQFRSHGIRVT